MSAVPASHVALVAPSMRILSLVLAAGICGQVFLAGLSIFSDAALWQYHRAVGGGLSLVIIALLALSVTMSSARRYRRQSIALFALYCLQVALVGLGRGLDVPFLSALHPLNGLLLMGAAVELVRQTFGRRNRR
ncbi:MAG: DUF6220 domain-containing protein [Allorhizobium sp.]